MLRRLITASLSCFMLLTSAVYAATQPSEQALVASQSAMLVDLDTGKTLYAEAPNLVTPIASVSKLMTALVVLDAGLPLNERITVDVSQSPMMQNVVSRIRLGSNLTRKEALSLALMASENRAATTLAHHYPGGYQAFVKAMNAKAKALGMNNSMFEEPTGLSPHNVSTAADLIKLLIALKKYPVIGELSVAKNRSVTFHKPRYSMAFYNTNPLVNRKGWHISLTKTGYTDEAGHCLAMLTKMGNRNVAFVALDSFGKYTHIADANRLKLWLTTGKSNRVPAEALQYKMNKRAEHAQQVGKQQLAIP
ncbi:D-alanyl-D-alanine endopeptidase [Shewanella avicenniae]|uniref:D-alanyl-D-alanine endopeptidase n=1 Tax=Shewanella avicenniae TaxID=2814294 RepID=A0ABX7QSC9_9GAMM|nr:D-alanyl-D-alanine endopeptidase [Shewanella avicenniae]QSX33608.1 D-alanyl-D-alanine endopeptidase [Shewanella avicenniae]